MSKGSHFFFILSFYQKHGSATIEPSIITIFLGDVWELSEFILLYEQRVQIERIFPMNHISIYSKCLFTFAPLKKRLSFPESKCIFFLNTVINSHWSCPDYTSMKPKIQRSCRKEIEVTFNLKWLGVQKRQPFWMSKFYRLSFWIWKFRTLLC